jgi:hypothetical protein
MVSDVSLFCRNISSRMENSPLPNVSFSHSVCHKNGDVKMTTVLEWSYVCVYGKKSIFSSTNSFLFYNSAIIGIIESNAMWKCHGNLTRRDRRASDWRGSLISHPGVMASLKFLSLSLEKP